MANTETPLNLDISVILHMKNVLFPKVDLCGSFLEHITQ